MQPADRQELREAITTVFNKMDAMQRDRHKQTLSIMAALNEKADK